MTPTQIPTAILVDGNKMPLIGFGTSAIQGSRPGDPGFDAMRFAIKSGYRLLDSAALYLNEEILGQVIKGCIDEGLVKREDLYVITKVWCTAHKRDSVMKACKDSLKKLGLDYVDLYLIHWPVAYVEDGDPINPIDPKTSKLLYTDTHYTETWRGMEDVKDAGLARSIGVSNFNHEMTDAIYALPCKHKPAVNQVECHPYLNQQKLHEYSKAHGIVLQAYCPLGSPGVCASPDQPAVLADPLILELAEQYKKSPAQIAIRFQIQRGISVIPKSVTPKRILENIDVTNFVISDSDMGRLMGLNQNLRYCTNTAGYYVTDHPFYPFHIEF